MTINTEKIQIASELLDRGLYMYYEGKSYFAALHLAGGAEEILGAYVELSGGESAFKNFQRTTVILSKLFNEQEVTTPKMISELMNHAKNRTKHMNSKDDEYVYFDPKVEAHILLDRAVSNYYTLMSLYDIPETDLISRFNHELIEHETKE